MKTLICDDHPYLRKGIEITLKDDYPDMQFAEVGSGEEALEILSHNSFDLVILDIALPGMNGFHALEQIKKLYPATPVLMLTGVPEYGQALRSFQMGASGYFTKRVIHEELLLAVKIILRGEKYFSRELSEELLKKEKSENKTKLFDQLTKRQKEIALKRAAG
jgi:two-component system, NarL family, invasion response regulator UvrY